MKDSRGAHPNTDFLLKLGRLAKRMIVVGTTPYAFTCPKDFDCVLCVFGEFPPSLKIAADILYGKKKAGRTWPIRSAATFSPRRP